MLSMEFYPSFEHLVNGKKKVDIKFRARSFLEVLIMHWDTQNTFSIQELIIIEKWSLTMMVDNIVNQS